MVDNETDGNFDSLLTDHIDALQELGNIGSGHSANALADLLNRRIDMSLPRFNKLPINDLPEVGFKDKNPDSIFAVVMLESTGEIPMNTLIVFDEETLDSLLRIIRDIDNAIDIQKLSTLDQSTISEVGNILGLHFITSINTFLGVKDMPLPPVLVIEKSKTVLSTIVSHYGKTTPDLLMIECDIFAANTKLSPLIILAPEPKSVEKTILKMFGV
jgi:chemotaxis protein CheC